MPVYEVPFTMTYPQAGSPGYNIWHVRTVDGAGTGDNDLQDAIDAIGAFYGAIRGLYQPSTTITGPELVEALPRPGTITPVGVFTTTGTSPNGSYLPDSTAICVNFRGTTSGRNGRGRKFLGPLSAQAADTSGNPTAQGLGAVRNALAALISSSSPTNGWAVGTYSRVTGLFTDAVGGTVKQDFAVLRSRRD